MATVTAIITDPEVLVGFASVLCALVYGLIVSIVNRRRKKSVNQTEEHIAVVNEIKSRVLGFITIAENLFSDIPKSGASKLLYVLNQVKELCKKFSLDYDQEMWTDFVNSIVGNSNRVQETKAYEDEKTSIIEKVKSEIPYIVEEANKLFERIPDSLQYKIEYILKFVAVACEKYHVNVYGEYDWRAYVKGLYEGE